MILIVEHANFERSKVQAWGEDENDDESNLLKNSLC